MSKFGGGQILNLLDDCWHKAMLGINCIVAFCCIQQWFVGLLFSSADHYRNTQRNQTLMDITQNNSHTHTWIKCNLCERCSFLTRKRIWRTQTPISQILGTPSYGWKSLRVLNTEKRCDAMQNSGDARSRCGNLLRRNPTMRKHYRCDAAMPATQSAIIMDYVGGASRYTPRKSIHSEKNAEATIAETWQAYYRSLRRWQTPPARFSSSWVVESSFLIYQKEFQMPTRNDQEVVSEKKRKKNRTKLTWVGVAQGSRLSNLMFIIVNLSIMSMTQTHTILTFKGAAPPKSLTCYGFLKSLRSALPNSGNWVRFRKHQNHVLRTSEKVPKCATLKHKWLQNG